MAESATTEQGNTESAQSDAQATASETEQGSTVLTGEGTSATADAESEQEDQQAEGDESEAEGEEAEQAGAPESYEDFSLPEGLEMDTSALEEASGVFKDLNLSQDQAQKLVDVMAAKVQRDQELADQQHQEMVQKWAEDAKQDPDMGGQNWKQTETFALKGMDALATPELRDFLKTTGLGNHPEMIRVFAHIGKLSSEPGFPGQPGSASKQLSPSRKMYPNME